MWSKLPPLGALVFLARSSKRWSIPNASVEHTVGMCGRYQRLSNKQRIAEAFAVHAGLEELRPEGDIAPGSVQPVIRVNAGEARWVERMRWGFKLPGRLLFNARSEGIEKAGFWKEAFDKRRCIVPADAFFEWRKVQSGKKPKFEFTVSGHRPFGMAGLWSPWKNPKTGEIERAFAIITGEANGVMRPIHDRQPTILEPRDYAEYLSGSERPPIHLLRIPAESGLRPQRVGHNPVRNQQAPHFDG